MDPIHVRDVERRLAAGNGGYKIVHSSPGMKVGVYVLVSPEPDRQETHDRDELYVVLEGRGTLQIEGDQVDLEEGEAAFVPTHADHRFVGYEGLSVLVIFADEGTSPGIQ